MLSIHKQFTAPTIKYRVWSELHKGMCQVTNVAFKPDGRMKEITGELYGTREKVVTLNPHFTFMMPATGKKDINGLDIYMWDIVRFKRDGKEKTLVVFWDNGWRVLGLDASGFEYWSDKAMEVVGNKYDTPEMWNEYSNFILTQ